MTDYNIETEDAAWFNRELLKFKSNFPNEFFKLKDSTSNDIFFSIGDVYAKKNNRSNSDISRAHSWFLLSVKYNSTNAYYDLGVLYFSGLIKTKYRESEAAQWFKRAAFVGDTRAYYYVGVMYHRGSGVPIDLGLARYYYTMGYQAGDKRCQFGLITINRSIDDIFGNV